MSQHIAVLCCWGGTSTKVIDSSFEVLTTLIYTQTELKILIESIVLVDREGRVLGFRSFLVCNNCHLKVLCSDFLSIHFGFPMCNVVGRFQLGFQYVLVLRIELRSSNPNYS